MRIFIGIPARMGSTRFPGKPLCNILNKSMIQHCYIRSSLSKHSSNLFVATCDEEIKNHVESFGGKVILTDKNIQRPGLRVAQAARELNLHDDDIVVVVQGDEPMIHPDMIDNAIEPLIKENDVFVSNNCTTITDKDWRDPGEIKVVCDLKMNAMYFSRSPIPFARDTEEKWDGIKFLKPLKHLGIYAYKKQFLEDFLVSKESQLERVEKLEQLRALQNGYEIAVATCENDSVGIDVPSDLKFFKTHRVNL